MSVDERVVGGERRLFAPELPESGGELTLPDASAQHARVLRLDAGARVELFDGKGGTAFATLHRISRAGVSLDAEPPSRTPRMRPLLHVVLGIPKGNKLEGIVRMLTELGVSALHLAACERSIPKASEERGRMERVGRIAIEACAQSGQPYALACHPPAPLLEVASRAHTSSDRFVFWERATAPLETLSIDASREEIWVVVGPEGGLANHEVESLASAGYAAVGLGPSRLRVETAAPVIAALVLDRMGRFRG